jgi:type I restriction enzyme, S subunit
MDLNNVEFSWINDIPINWSIERVKNHFVLTKNTTDNPDNFPILSLTMRGIIERDISTNEGQLPETYNGYNLLEENDIVFNPMDLISGWVDCSPTRGLISPSYKVIRPISESVSIKFYTYYFQTHYKERIFFPFGEGVHYEYRWGLGTETLRNFPIVVLPLSEQQQIVSFLDTKTSLIDSLIEKTYRKIELLKENRTSLINEVVTKGLNPNVEMKDSGVEWIGEIPSHWVVSKLKYDSSIPVQYGINISGDKYVEEGIRFVRITDISESGDLNPDDGKYLVPEDVPNEFLLRKFDVLFCRSGHTVGKTYLHTSDGLFSSGGYLVRFNFRNYTESKFIFYLSKTHFYWDWIKLNTVVSTIENVNGDKYQNFIYSKPPHSEQQQIVSYLDEQTQKIDKTISIEEKRIELLKEYRQSLISEVVTGKRKVVE